MGTVTPPSAEAADKVPASVVPSGVVYAFQFAAVGVWVAFAAVYFQERGVSLALIGVLAAVPSAVTIPAAPAWGLVADRLGDVRPPYLVAALWAAGWSLVLALRPGMPWLALIVVLMAGGTAGLTPLVDARTVQRLWPDRARFGQARVFGSIAFVASTIGVGALVAVTGLPAMFVVHAVALAGAGIAAFVLLGRSDPDRRVASVGPLAGLGLLREPGLGLFFVASAVAWTSNGAAITLMSLRMIELGGDTQLVGIGWAVNAAVEIPMMVAFARVARRYPVEGLIILGMGVLVLRSVLWWLASSPPAFIAVTALSGVSFALMLVGTTTYVATRVPSSLRATAQAMFSSTTYAIGMIAGAVLAGLVAQAGGIVLVYPVSAAGAAIGTVLAWWAIARPGGRGARRTPPA